MSMRQMCMCSYICCIWKVDVLLNCRNDQATVEYLTDPKEQNVVLNLSQTSHEIHRWSWLLHLYTDHVTSVTNKMHKAQIIAI